MAAYYPLTTDDKEYPLADPSVDAMIRAYAIEVRAGHKDAASRAAAAVQMGIETPGEELTRPAYIVAMAGVLFPTAKDRIGDGGTVNVPEVLRAIVDFFDALS